MNVDKLGNRIIALGALVAPGLAAIGVRHISPSPAAAVASVRAVEETPTVTVAVTPEAPLGAEQLRAKELAEAAVEKSLVTPFLTAADPVVASLVEGGKDDGQETKPSHGPMNLTSIFSGRTTVAIINGKLRAVGDEVEPGWKVATVEANTGVVTVEGPRGQQITLRLRRTSLDQR